MHLENWASAGWLRLLEVKISPHTDPSMGGRTIWHAGLIQQQHVLQEQDVLHVLPDW